MTPAPHSLTGPTLSDVGAGPFIPSADVPRPNYFRSTLTAPHSSKQAGVHWRIEHDPGPTSAHRPHTF